MGLAPSRNGENSGKPAVAKVPVPISSQPLRAPHATTKGLADPMIPQITAPSPLCPFCPTTFQPEKDQVKDYEDRQET
jgi:hypothetical protein